MSKRLDIPDCEPKSFRAGDTVKWTRTHADYPASEWTLKYFLVKDGEEEEVAATADGDTHSITIAASTTANYDPGRYMFQGRFEKDTEYYTEYQGVIEVLKEFEGSSGYEWRIHAEQALENIEAVLLDKATVDNLSYTIAGRSLSKYSWEELRDMRTHYKKEILAFDRKHGLKRGQKIQIQF